ncbi:2',5'-phosphodiesterase 12 [Eleutherodactylus coqui]|uniref:2',5'-phosphodiesterase 12 n=1 Tax=Eleutherodactylus coqui TaxID=57060 RepID=UPI003463464E
MSGASSRLLSGLLRLCGRPGGMDKAVVRAVPSEAKLSISLTLSGSQRQLQRDQTEALGRALARISASATKTKKRKEPPAPGPPVRLFYRGQPVNEAATNAEAWQDGAELLVGNLLYRVERNPPMCHELDLPRHVMAGFPVCPRLRLEFADAEHSLFTWYKQQPQAAEEAGDSPGSPGRQQWVEACHERVFTPAVGDIGLRLKLRCTPGDGQRLGESRELEVDGPVEAGAGACTFDERHLYTQRLTEEPVIRTVSYNLLADVYAQTEHARTVLFPYCAPYALELEYRHCLIRKELSGYRADLLCLQEVDRTVFSDSLAPALEAFGLDGLFRLKDKQHEGLSTFYRRSRFRLCSQHDILLGEALTADPLHQEMLQRLSCYPAAKEKMLQRSSALQVSVFESTTDPSRKICVANTHLYFHPKGGNIRLLQIAVALSHVRHVAYELYPGIPVIFCGDFNSTPSTGMYSFVRDGTISENHEDWTSNGEEEQCNMSLGHPLKLKSACGEPAYTNYVGGFHGCLDYIFIDCDNLDVEQVIPMPSHEEVTSHQALPSVSHPSDHIALICDLRWK